MITVEVTLFAVLKRYNPDPEGNSFSWQVKPGATARDLLDSLGVPWEKNMQVFVNYRIQKWDYTLQDGDKVAFFPTLAGG